MKRLENLGITSYCSRIILLISHNRFFFFEKKTESKMVLIALRGTGCLSRYSNLLAIHIFIFLQILGWQLVNAGLAGEWALFLSSFIMVTEMVCMPDLWIHITLGGPPLLTLSQLPIRKSLYASSSGTLLGACRIFNLWNGEKIRCALCIRTPALKGSPASMYSTVLRLSHHHAFKGAQIEMKLKRSWLGGS